MNKCKQHIKELNSLRNKMGTNLVWFDSLNKTQQYDVLFRWKKAKYENTKNPNPRKVKSYVRGYGYKEVIIYPTKFKFFINELKSKIKPSKIRIRESAINILLKK